MSYLVTTLLAAVGTVAAAEPVNTLHFSVGTDALPWVSHGYSAMVAVEGATTPLRVTAEIWSLEFPSAIVELNPENAGEGWARRATGLSLYFDWHFTEAWHAGLIVGGLRSRVWRQDHDGSSHFMSYEALARGGYRWLPFDELGLYLNPWVAAGPIVAVGGDSLGDQVFDELPIQILATLHLGWRF